MTLWERGSNVPWKKVPKKASNNGKYTNNTVKKAENKEKERYKQRI